MVGHCTPRVPQWCGYESHSALGPDLEAPGQADEVPYPAAGPEAAEAPSQADQLDDQRLGRPIREQSRLRHETGTDDVLRPASTRSSGFRLYLDELVRNVGRRMSPVLVVSD
jgi:hypothetical protein